MLKFLRKTALYVFLLPVLLVWIGAASNQLVLYANNDTFPVRVNEAKMKYMLTDEDGVLHDPVILSDGTVMIDAVHCVMTDKTHLNLLADIFDFKSSTESAGDLMIEKGAWLFNRSPFIWGLVLYARSRREDEYKY